MSEPGHYPVDPSLGTEDLERGMRPGHARDVAIIGLVAVAMLLVFNSGGLAKWTEGLPSSQTTAWIAERAGDWHRRMLDLGPAKAFESVRQRLRGD